MYAAHPALSCSSQALLWLHTAKLPSAAAISRRVTSTDKSSTNFPGASWVLDTSYVRKSMSKTTIILLATTSTKVPNRQTGRSQARARGLEVGGLIRIQCFGVPKSIHTIFELM